jgi:hypothetical protein
MFVLILSIDGGKSVIQLVLSLPHPLPYCSLHFLLAIVQKNHIHLYSPLIEMKVCCLEE